MLKQCKYQILGNQTNTLPEITCVKHNSNFNV